MKRIIPGLLVVLIVSLSSFKTSEHGFEWQQWNQGFIKAKQEGKIALIDTYTDWCGWCKKMDRDTYEDSAIIARINKDFIPIKFNPELAGEYALGDTMVSGRALLTAMSKDGKSTGYPTTFFYLPKQNRMYQYPGYMDANKFGKLLDELVRVHALSTRPN
jgi:uncharacterized protein YyaL (SSP411 family)